MVSGKIFDRTSKTCTNEAILLNFKMDDYSDHGRKN